MGDPTDCTDEGLILNGEFDSDQHWNINNLWEIHDGVAEVEWLVQTPDINLFQFVDLVIGGTYILDFTILEASTTGAGGLRARLGGNGGPRTGTIQAAGNYRFEFVYNGLGEFLLFFGFFSSQGPAHFILDSVRFASLEGFIACAMNMLNMDGTQREFVALGGGRYMVSYGNRDGKTAMWFEFDINAWP